MDVRIRQTWHHHAPAHVFAADLGLHRLEQFRPTEGHHTTVINQQGGSFRASRVEAVNAGVMQEFHHSPGLLG